jgi:hypothetical protein
MVQRLLAIAPTSVFQTFLATINFHTSIPPISCAPAKSALPQPVQSISLYLTVMAEVRKQ